MSHAAFDASVDVLSSAPLSIAGGWRRPVNLLVAQTYDSHASIHDDATAGKLGFKGGTVEGPTHFSQFAPLFHHLWGNAWFEQGTISANYRSPAYEGEEVLARVTLTTPLTATIEASKRDGTVVLSGTACVGHGTGESAVSAKRAAARPITDPRILAGTSVGMRTRRRTVSLPFTQRMGDLYPFSLEEKLRVITEPSSWYLPGALSPWGRPVMPVEMISVLCQHIAAEDPFPVANPVVGLFADQEVRVINGPLFPDVAYEIEREVIALSATPKTESMWIRSRLYLPGESAPVAEMDLNQAFLKLSSPLYAEQGGAGRG
jgi:hypothetical protein